MLKVVKENDQSLLLNHFGRDGREYLVVSILTFFNFERPEEPLPEKELWHFVQDELGEDVILDAGLPKVHGEVLLSAKCFAPKGQTVRGCPVSFSLGPISKELYVFGPRRWRTVAPGAHVITDPEPFTQVDLTWRNAFGGPDHKPNPLGKGAAQPENPDAQWLLPNVEYPRDLIGRTEDEPQPAGFLPLDVMWPQRFSKQGTYDDRWLQEEYPYYPKDMDWSFFNAAPEDQWLRDAFFTGKENILLEGLHPRRLQVSSKLPGRRQRCFLLQRVDRTGREPETKFTEFNTRLDTVWLFPHAERGVTIHRAVAEVKDDEHSDVLRLFLAREALAETPKGIEYYREEMERRLNRQVEVNLAALEEAKKKIKKALERISGIDQEIKDNVKQALGQAPAVDKKTPGEFAADAQARALKAIEKLDKAEARLVPLKAEYGHIVKIDLSAISRAKEKLQAAAQKAGQAAAEIEAAQAKVEAAKARLKKDLLASPQADRAAEAGMDIDALIYPPPKNPWHEAGMKFLYQARKDLESDWEASEFLRDFGLERRTIKKSFLGIHPAFQTSPAADWGLESGSEGPEVELPGGLVIPRFEGALLKKLLIVQRPYDRPETVHLVDGSEDVALDIGLDPDKPVVRVRNELEAWLIRQEIGDLAGIVSLADSGLPLSDDAAEAVKAAPQFLVIENADQLPNPEAALESWKKLNPQAEFLPWIKGKPMSEARKDGEDLRRWVLLALKPGFVPEGALVEEPRPGDHAPKVVIPDIKALVLEIQGMIQGAIGPKVAKAKAGQAELEAKVAKHLEERGYSLAALKAEAAAAPKPKPFDSGQVKDAFAQVRQTFQKTGSLTPEVEQTLAEHEARLSAITDKAAAKFAAGQAKIEQAENIKPIPDWARAKLARLGVDPDDMAPLTREEVQKRYAEGRSLSGKNMSGTDLSGLDLTGVDFRKAHLQGTNFQGARLDQADLSDAIGQEADFTGASLKSARLGKGILQKAKFGQADLTGADLTRALLNESDFSQADLSGAVLDKALLEKAVLAGTILRGASIKRGYFLQAQAPEADFGRADLSRSIFLEAQAPQAKFDGASLHRVTFQKTKGGNNSFAGADLNDVRAVEETAFPDSDFSQATADKGYWRSADLSGADFQDGRLNNVIFEGCDMQAANLSRVKAHKARFNKSDLSGARMTGLDLFMGSLRKTRLVEADLSRANLYCVEVFKTVMGRTKLDGTNLKMTRIEQYKDIIK